MRLVVIKYVQGAPSSYLLTAQFPESRTIGIDLINLRHKRILHLIQVIMLVLEPHIMLQPLPTADIIIMQRRYQVQAVNLTFPHTSK